MGGGKGPHRRHAAQGKKWMAECVAEQASCEAERTQALPMRNTASAATILTSSSIFMMRFTEPFGTRSVVGVFSFMFDIAACDASSCDLSRSLRRDFAK